MINRMLALRNSWLLDLLPVMLFPGPARGQVTT